MRYRQLSNTGDYLFGGGVANFYINTPEAVGQAVLTRLKLQLGEWFLNFSDGTPWSTQILGHNTAGSRDAIIQDRILGTFGVIAIVNYSSFLNVTTRAFSVTVRISTIYGIADLVTTL